MKSFNYIDLLYVAMFLVVSHGLDENCNEEPIFRSPKHFKGIVEKKVLEISETELLELVSGDDSSLSLNASWKLVLDAKSKSKRHDRIEQFIGVVNSRVCRVPAWWQDVVRSTNASPHSVPRFGRPSQETRQKCRSEGFSDFGNHLQEPSTKNQIEIRTKEFVFSIPKTPKKLSYGPYDFNFVTDGQFCFYSNYFDLCYSYQIKAHSALHNDVVWERPVWASGNLLVISGPTWHLTEFVVADSETLVVFGSGAECIYIESFDLKSGNPITKFSSLYSWLPNNR